MARHVFSCMWLNEHVYNHACDYIDFQQIVYGNIANQIHGFTTDYGKFVLILRAFSTLSKP